MAHAFNSFSSLRKFLKEFLQICSGRNDGRNVGFKDGLNVGKDVGLNEGVIVGNNVGSSLGDAVSHINQKP